MSLAQRLQLYGVAILLAALPVSKALAEILSTLLILGWLWAREHPWPTRAWWVQWRKDPLAFPLAAWLAVSAFSICVSTVPATSLQGFVGKTLEYACLCWSVASLATIHTHWRQWWQGLIVGSLCVVVDIGWQCYSGADVLGHPWDYYNRITGPFTNPHDLATYFIMTIPVMIGGALSLPRSARWWRHGSMALAVVLTLLLLATVSRSGWLGMAWAVAIFVCAWPTAARWFHVLLVAAGLALIGIAIWSIVSISGRGYFSVLFGPGLQDRWFMWQAAWRMWCDRWWLGHGVNTFMSQYLTYWVGGEHLPRYAHNCYLQTGAETGVLGVLAFLWVLVTIVREGCRGIRRWAGQPTRPLLMGALAAVGAFMVQAFFDTNFYSLRSATYFWAIAGVLMGLAAAQPAGTDDHSIT